MTAVERRIGQAFVLPPEEQPDRARLAARENLRGRRAGTLQIALRRAASGREAHDVHTVEQRVFQAIEPGHARQHVLRLVRDALDAIGIVLARAHEAQVAKAEILERAHHVRDVDEVLGLVQNDDDTHRSDDPNAECGMRNAELQGKVVRVTTLALTFRIPHSEFRIPHLFASGLK